MAGEIIKPTDVKNIRRDFGTFMDFMSSTALLDFRVSIYHPTHGIEPWVEAEDLPDAIRARVYAGRAQEVAQWIRSQTPIYTFTGQLKDGIIIPNQYEPEDVKDFKEMGILIGPGPRKADLIVSWKTDLEKDETARNISREYIPAEILPKVSPALIDEIRQIKQDLLLRECSYRGLDPKLFRPEDLGGFYVGDLARELLFRGMKGKLKDFPILKKDAETNFSNPTITTFSNLGLSQQS